MSDDPLSNILTRFQGLALSEKAQRQLKDPKTGRFWKAPEGHTWGRVTDERGVQTVIVARDTTAGNAAVLRGAQQVCAEVCVQGRINVADSPKVKKGQINFVR